MFCLDSCLLLFNYCCGLVVVVGLWIVYAVFCLWFGWYCVCFVSLFG